MKKFSNSVVYALKGILTCFKSENNFKIQTVVALVVLLMGFCLELSKLEWIVIFFSIGLVLAFEIINSAIEQLCNFVHPQQNEHIGRIKDLSAGAVLIVTISSIVVGCIIFLPKIF